MLPVSGHNSRKPSKALPHLYQRIIIPLLRGRHGVTTVVHLSIPISAAAATPATQMEALHQVGYLQRIEDQNRRLLAIQAVGNRLEHMRTQVLHIWLLQSLCRQLRCFRARRGRLVQGQAGQLTVLEEQAEHTILCVRCLAFDLDRLTDSI